MKKYNCPNCNAELYWDENKHALYCEYCGHTYQPEELTVKEKKNSNSYQNADTNQKATDKSDNDNLVVYKCEHCGAEIVTAKSTIATKCAYCGRAITLSDKNVENFNPDYVLPFAINKETAIKCYKDFCKSKMNVPSKFYTNSTVKEIKGVYVPFWLNDFDAEVDTKFDFVKDENSYSSGDDRITVTEIYNKHLKEECSFEKFPIDALKKLDDKLMNSIVPYDYNDLKAFNPGYMAGFYGEIFDENSDTAKDKAVKNAVKRITKDIKEKYMVKGNLDENSLHFKNGDISSYYAMMPVWLMHVSYKGKDYISAINGQTGKAYGEFPISKIKKSIPKFIWLFYIIIAIILAFYYS